MTEFTELVDEQRLKIEIEEWGKKISYIHASNGIIETKFNNGDIQYVENKPRGKTTWYRENPESLVDRFYRWKADNK